MAIAAIAGGIAAAGSLAGGALAARGAGQQAEAAERSSREALAETRRQFDISRSDMMPWLTAGGGALGQLSHLLGIPGVPASPTFTSSTGMPLSTSELARLRQLEEKQRRKQARGGQLRPGRFGELQALQERAAAADAAAQAAAGAPVTGGTTSTFDPATFGSLQRDFSAADFQTDLGYEFRLREGMKALERAAAARGTVLSGGTLRELNRYNQDQASGEFGRAFDRFNINRATRFNQLASIAGAGQQTAQTLGGLGSDYARTFGDITIGGQTAAAAARASGYGAWSNAIQNAANIPLNWQILSEMAERDRWQPASGGRVFPGGGAAYPCWIAEVLWGVDDNRTHLLRAWLTQVWEKHSRVGALVVGAYRKLGQRVAEWVKRSSILRAVVQPLFEAGLYRARRWAEGR